MTHKQDRRHHMEQLTFIDKYGNFSIRQPENISYLYFPLASEKGMKSSITPNLGGDSKIDQETFLLEPVSAENIHNNRSVRNFWIACKGEGDGDGESILSAAGASAEQEHTKFTSRQDQSRITAGFMWHSLERIYSAAPVRTCVTSFIPVDENVEIMQVTIHNRADHPITITPYAAIPIYGRSADNIRDHRNVTSMLHRIETCTHGILVCPTMSFDERGHRPNSNIYYVYGYGDKGETPECFYPTVEDFLGEGGTYIHPRSVYEKSQGVPIGHKTAGKEAMGAFRFPKVRMRPGEKKDYILLFGIEDEQPKIARVFEKYNTPRKLHEALTSTQEWWKGKVNIEFHTGSGRFDRLMKWICFQPFLRRMFGCSFLPHHDYGRGGRGWRDLWQDCLSLLLMQPDEVGHMIEKNFGGVRIDGTNATIIGDGDGNFIADRNGISRVWMDHSIWPLMTTKLYIDQTGDVRILNRKAPYFKDAQTERGTQTDVLWNHGQGCLLRTENNEIYSGTILEHLLVQQLSTFYEVGAHNICRLRGADWNDALDMASENGESVAFTCACAGNLRELSLMIRILASHSGEEHAELAEELQILLCDDVYPFEDVHEKQKRLGDYVKRCTHRISGRRFLIRLSDLSDKLEQKADRLAAYLREHEWIDGKDDEGWFNSYYDDHGRAVEGFFRDHVRMMLTGQVFAIMGNVASEQQIRQIVNSADHYLYRKEIGGYRLNTDFHELKFDMGRMFGFAYGEKENGAVFSHMTVMYANALYRRRFAKEGWKALRTLADAALDFRTSRIYPGIPEYFRADGRGMYHYLTGAASWFMMTMLTQVYGVRGSAGDLVLDPQLTAEQFDQSGIASVTLPFAGKTLEIRYKNPKRRDVGTYEISSISCDEIPLQAELQKHAIIPRTVLESLPGNTHHLIVTLTARTH